MRKKLHLAWHAAQQLGAPSLVSYARYHLALRSGLLGLQTRTPNKPRPCLPKAGLFPIPDRAALAEILKDDVRRSLMAEAEEIINGECRIFGGQKASLAFEGAGDAHWTEYERRGAGALCAGLPGGDIKYLWEPARFGWAFTLGRAYRLNGDERCARAFWETTERFAARNPAYRGVHWLSAQEVALRLMALVFAWQVFHTSAHSTPPRAVFLGHILAEHAARIPPSLDYARAQANNHLISEAAGLFTAGLALPDHPRAARWRETGWREFNAAVQAQITPQGVYVQQSANYQRLVLSEALWVARLAEHAGQALPEETRRRLGAATRFLKSLMDPHFGELPNWGHNDGALGFPFAGGAFRDYRPVLSAAEASFCPAEEGVPAEQTETTLWQGSRSRAAMLPPAEGPCVMRHPRLDSWVFLRCGRFHARPAHADQNHLDLWWRGFNLALDAGTFLYNAPPPWDNALTTAHVHNTVTVNGLDQMRRVGRFLYLDWAQGTSGHVEDGLACEHDGYRRLGLVHKRSVRALFAEGWEVRDEILTAGAQTANTEVTVRLHWLLPDGRFEVSRETEQIHLDMETNTGSIRLVVETENIAEAQPVVIRAGEPRLGRSSCLPQPEVMGWAAPLYGVKEAAISFSVEGRAVPPCGFRTRWQLPAL